MHLKNFVSDYGATVQISSIKLLDALYSIFKSSIFNNSDCIPSQKKFYLLLESLNNCSVEQEKRQATIDKEYFFIVYK